MWIRAIYFTFVAAMLPVFAQPQTPPAFDVASIRPTQHGGKDVQGFTHSSANITGPGRFVAENSSLDELIRFAYSLKDYQISGPVWLNDKSESFDVLAKASPAPPNQEMRVMLQTLLKERFRLTAHFESKMLPVYELVIGSKGSRLRQADPAGRRRTSSAGGTMTVTKATMTDFAYDLSRELKYPVFDRTGLTGAFDIALSYSREEDGQFAAPSLFTALEEVTGLKLKAAKGPVEVLVIDHVEKVPTEN